jgi:hypothetical protein
VQLKPGTKLKSVTCDAEVVVVKGSGEHELTCGGAPMVAADAEAPRVDLDAAHSGGILLGKRYTNGDATVEILGVKAGAGSLTLDGEPLELKSAKPLPSSD